VEAAVDGTARTKERIVHLLLQNVSTADVQKGCYDKALNLARRRREPSIVKLFEAAGARVSDEPGPAIIEGTALGGVDL
jgi:hypothetical protein